MTLEQCRPVEREVIRQECRFIPGPTPAPAPVRRKQERPRQQYETICTPVEREVEREVSSKVPGGIKKKVLCATQFLWCYVANVKYDAGSCIVGRSKRSKGYIVCVISRRLIP